VRTEESKSFLVLFFKKELLPCLPSRPAQHTVLRFGPGNGYDRARS
jgi:hypothetical protein